MYYVTKLNDYIVNIIEKLIKVTLQVPISLLFLMPTVNIYPGSNFQVPINYIVDKSLKISNKKKKSQNKQTCAMFIFYK